MCGYSEKITAEQKNTIMHHYVSADGKRRASMNRAEEKFTATSEDKKISINWVRADVFEKEQQAPDKAPDKAPTK
jgi:hypothetical protein